MYTGKINNCAVFILLTYCSEIRSLPTALLLGWLFSDAVKLSDYHFGGGRFNARLELSIFTLMATRQKTNCECGTGSELFNGFWEGHADARHAVASVSGP